MVSDRNESAVTVAHDGDGNRVSETAGGVTTKDLVDTLNPTGLPQVLDEKVSGSVTRTYAYGLQRISENRLVSGTWTPRFYGYNGHGNVRFLTNSAGAITDSYDYDAFGMPIRTRPRTHAAAGLPSHLRRFPLKYKTGLASAESINPKRDRLVESHLSRNERWATAHGTAKAFGN